MATQTVYKETMDAARVGMLADTTNTTLLSRNIEGAAVGFGKPVVQGAADKGARISTTGDTKILGITVRERSTLDDEFAVGDSARVATVGAIWVSVVAAVAAGDPVHVIVADGTFTNTGGVEITEARYDTSAAIGELALVRMK